MIHHTTLHDDLPPTAAERWGWRYRATAAPPNLRLLRVRTANDAAPGSGANDAPNRLRRVRVARQCRAHATEHRETHGIG